MKFRGVLSVLAGVALLALAVWVQEPRAAVEDTRSAPPLLQSADHPSQTTVTRDGWYYDKDCVVLYLRTYDRLPGNFITKEEARRLGWTGGSLERYAPGKAIGGDRFGNYEGRLPRGSWRECDIDTKGRPRGTKRLVYSDDRRYYYTEDHYQTFTKVP